MKIPFKTIFLADSGGYSSKRIFGALGYLTTIGISIACTVLDTLAPTLVVDLCYSSVALLGVDSVTNIWKGGNRPPHKMYNKEEIPDEEI